MAYYADKKWQILGYYISDSKRKDQQAMYLLHALC